MEGLGQKEKGLMDMDNSVVIGGGGGEVIRGLNGHGKNAIKFFLKKKVVETVRSS